MLCSYVQIRLQSYRIVLGMYRLIFFFFFVVLNFNILLFSLQKCLSVVVAFCINLVFTKLVGSQQLWSSTKLFCTQIIYLTYS